MQPAQQPAEPQKTRSSGIGCTNQETLRKIFTCVAAQGRDCEQEQSDLINATSCAMIPAGVEVRIEAGSYSFEMLRIRVPGHQAPLWTDRGLVFER